MNKWIKSAAMSLPLFLMLSGCSSDGQPKQAKQEVVKFNTAYVVATRTDASLLDVDCKSSIWENAPENKVTLYNQKTVVTNDKRVADAMEGAGSKEAEIKVVYNNKQVAFMVSWEDDTQSIQGANDNQTYGDGFALQFAVDGSNPEKLPYIGMGNPGNPVAIYMQKSGVKIYEPNGFGDVKRQLSEQSLNKFGSELRAYHNDVHDLAASDYQKVFISEGFRSMTEKRDAKQSFISNMGHKGNQWHAVLVRDIMDVSLMTDLSGPAFPLAIAIWDGGKANRDGQKWLSRWTAVTPSDAVATDYIATLNHQSTGDVAKGKELAAQNCAACHIFDDQNNGMPFMAPGLSNIGGQATSHYIKESIVNPSAVVVPGYNRNAHPNYKWYELDEEGKRISTMPAYDWMEESQVNDLVAYFQTLKK
jgi:complex iron-sulfur molybdoenzyme family reductase subunit gamma